MQFKNVQKYLFLILLALLIMQSSLFSQINNRENNRLNNIFHKIERNINNGDVGGISGYFSNRVFVNLPPNVSNYFSGNHLYYLLKDYFSTHSAMYFAFDTISMANSNPFGYGKFTYDYNGERRHATIYVSFSKIGNNWKITQLTVN